MKGLRNKIQTLVERINKRFIEINTANMFKNQFKVQFYRNRCILYHNGVIYKSKHIKCIYDDLLEYLELIK